MSVRLFISDGKQTPPGGWSVSGIEHSEIDRFTPNLARRLQLGVTLLPWISCYSCYIGGQYVVLPQ